MLMYNIKDWKGKLLKLLDICYIKQCCTRFTNYCVRFCLMHKIKLLNLLRSVLILFSGIISFIIFDFNTSIILLIISVVSFCLTELVLWFAEKKHTNTFTYLVLIILMLAHGSGAAFQYVSLHYFIPVYILEDMDDIRIFSGINNNRKTEADINSVLDKVREVISSLKNEFRTVPPQISLMITGSTEEFAHIIKGNSSYSIDDSDDVFDNIPMVTKGNTIIVNLSKKITGSDKFEETFKYQLFYELSHIYYNNYSLNRDIFIKEGLARYFSSKYTGYDKLDVNYELFLSRWKNNLEKEYLIDKNNIPLILGRFVEEKAYENPKIWEDSGNLAYNLINWMVENYSSKVLDEIISDLGKGSKSDETLIRITGFDVKGAVWHSIMDDWYRKSEIRMALAKSIPNMFSDMSKYIIYIGNENSKIPVPGEFYSDELINWLNINLPIQPEITIIDMNGNKILQTQKNKIIYPANDKTQALS